MSMHDLIMYGHPKLMHLLIFTCDIIDLITLIACNTTALIPIEGIGAQQKVAYSERDP